MPQNSTYPNDYRTLMKARKEGLLVQSEQEYRREQYLILENQIRRRQAMYEQYYGPCVTEKERIDYYALIDRKYRGMLDEKNALYPERVRAEMDRVRALIDNLRELGVSEESIGELMRPARPLSRLYITSDYRIYLPEYGNAEVTLGPLPKAVFILFLRHPEGIVLKEIGDYFAELWQIYKTIMGRRFREVQARESLERICNPLNNALNEKISRIRETLRTLIDESLLTQYSITGKRSEVWQVLLPQTLINWEQ